MHVHRMLEEPVKDQGHLAPDKRTNGEKKFTERTYFNTHYPVSAQIRSQLTVNICKRELTALVGANLLDFSMAGSKWTPRKNPSVKDAARIQIFGPKVNNNSRIIKKKMKVPVRTYISQV